MIEKIDAFLKTDTPQSATTDGNHVSYNRIDKSLCLTGTSHRVNKAKLLVLEGLERLASDSKARASQDLWSKHVAPDLTSPPDGKKTDLVHGVEIGDAKMDDSKSPVMNDTNQKPYQLSEDSDRDLIKAWEDLVLPALDGVLCSEFDPSMIVTVQREGFDEVSSQPTIRIYSSISRAEPEEVRLKNRVLALLPERLRSSCRVEFSKGSIRRSGNGSKAVTNAKYQPPICVPRNRKWTRKPAMGSSIGRGGSQDDTATLGGYLLIDGVSHILTVHHLFEEEVEPMYGHGRLRKGQYQITQPSAQELRDIDAERRNLRDRIGRFEGDQATLLEWMSQLKELDKLHDTIPKDERLWRFGEVIASSGYRNRLPRHAPDAQSSFRPALGLPVEMDWAICSVPEERVGSNEIGSVGHYPPSSRSGFGPPTQTARQTGSTDTKRCTKTCEPAGGVSVHSVGRTSHYQTGVVSRCGAWVRQRTAGGDFRSSVEWNIMRPASHSLAAWSEGGMGVDGDSGSWIVRDDSNDVMGLLWGRIQTDDGRDPITLFTPIQDVFADILDTIGPKSLYLPGAAHLAASDTPSMPLDLTPLQKRKTQTPDEMLPPPKRRSVDPLGPTRRCGKCLPPPSAQLLASPPTTPTHLPPRGADPQRPCQCQCDCALEMSPPATPYGAG